MTTINVKELWAKACDYDGIKKTSKFVIFGINNPYARQYNNAMLHVAKALRPIETIKESEVKQ